MRGKIFYRINSLHWVDILVLYALFVLQDYLTDVWKLSLNHASAILNMWNGMYRILPVFFLYLVDSFLGHFKLLVVTTISFCAGTVFVFMSLPPILAELTHTCKAYELHCVGDTQVGLLYAGLALIAVGLAGNHVSVHKFLDEQREVTNHNSGGLRADLIVVVIVGAFGKVIPFIRPWTLRFGIPAVFSILVTLSFITGSSSYHKEPPNPNGSPLSHVCRVYVVAARKMFRPYPDDNQRYHRRNEEEFSSTGVLRVLHKAAIIEENGVSNRWSLCSVAEVEDAKVIVRMVPMWMTFIVCGIISSTGDTYFVEQAVTLDRHIGKLKLPVEVFLLVKMVFSYWIKFHNEHRLSSTASNNVESFLWFSSMTVFSVLCCIAAAGIERMRLKVVRKNGLLDKADEDVPMSVFWLLSQFSLLAPVEEMPSSMNSYYRDQCPRSLEAYLQSFSRAMYGFGFICCSLFVYVVGRISEIGGRPNWFQETLNKSRLDRYYWVLAVLSTVNYVMLYVVFYYMIKQKEGRGELDAGGANADENEEGENAENPNVKGKRFMITLLNYILRCFY